MVDLLALPFDRLRLIEERDNVRAPAEREAREREVVVRVRLAE